MILNKITTDLTDELGYSALDNPVTFRIVDSEESCYLISSNGKRRRRPLFFTQDEFDYRCSHLSKSGIPLICYRYGWENNDKMGLISPITPEKAEYDRTYRDLHPYEEGSEHNNWERWKSENDRGDYRKDYYEAHKEQENQYNKQWRDNHREERKEYMRVHRSLTI